MFAVSLASNNIFYHCACSGFFEQAASSKMLNHGSVSEKFFRWKRSRRPVVTRIRSLAAEVFAAPVFTCFDRWKKASKKRRRTTLPAMQRIRLRGFVFAFMSNRPPKNTFETGLPRASPRSRLPFAFISLFRQHSRFTKVFSTFF
jgi:hypothetical protein